MEKGQCSLCYDIATKYKLPELNYNINKNIKNGKNSCLSLGHMDTIILLVNIKQGVDQEGQQNNNYCLKQNTSVYRTTVGMEARHPKITSNNHLTFLAICQPHWDQHLLVLTEILINPTHTRMKKVTINATFLMSVKFSPVAA